MNPVSSNVGSRRGFLKASGQVVAASALAAGAVPHVFAAEDNTIQLALVGCGGRGTGAAGDALNTSQLGPIKLVAMADIFENRLNVSFDSLKKQHADRVDVPPERRFIGFDGYQKAMDCLKPGDVVLLTTPCAFRWPMFTRAIDKNLNVFMEKPVTVDGPSARKMLALADKATAKNLKVAVGLMCRHCRARLELLERIRGGAIGDIVSLNAYRLVGPAGFSGPRPENMSEVMFQTQRYLSFFWASGGVLHDYVAHNIDECCWMKGSWPVKAVASGGRLYRGPYVDQNFDHYNIEFVFADGTKLHLAARNMTGCHEEFASYAYGSKGSAVISTFVHTPAKCRIYKGHNFVKEDLVWAFPQPEPNPYQLEWDDLIDAIRNNKPYNEARRGTEASLVSTMGRMAAHTGKIVTWDQMLNHEHEFAPTVDRLTMNSEAPLPVGPDGKYALPQPGIVTAREF